MRYIILVALAVIALALALWLSLVDVARAEVTCNPIDKMRALKDVGAEPVFLAKGVPGIAYVIYVNPTPGEWVAFAIAEKQDKACNVASGFGYSVIVPKDEPAK